jgi:hypothetical protein
MRSLRSYYTGIAFVIILAMLVSIGGSFYQRILADIRYAAMDEKEASKDILIQKESTVNQFDISEYDELLKIFT